MKRYQFILLTLFAVLLSYSYIHTKDIQHDQNVVIESSPSTSKNLGGGFGTITKLTNSVAIGGAITGGTTGSVLFVDPTATIAQDNANFFWDNTNNRLGIGTTSPSYKLDVAGTTAAMAVNSQVGYNLSPVVDPSSYVSGTIAAGGSLGTGAYYYAVSFVTALGETHLYGSTSATATTTAGNNTINLTGIPVSSDSRVTSRKIYRSTVNGQYFNLFLVATIADNTTTTYTDTTADGSLGSTNGFFRVNTTTNFITVGGTKSMVIDNNATLFGVGAGLQLTSGGRDTLIGTEAGRAITTGGENTAVGYNAGYSITTGSGNSFYGTYAGVGILTGAYNSGYGRSSLSNIAGGSSSNSAYGAFSGQFVTGGSNNSFLGYYAGTYLNDGATSLTAPQNSIYIGTNSRGYSATETNAIVIGYGALGLGSNTTVIGNSSTTTTALWGKVSIGTTSSIAQLGIVNQSAGGVATVIRGAAGQSANLVQFQDAVATVLSRVGADGSMFIREDYSSGTAVLMTFAGNRATYGIDSNADFYIDTSAGRGTAFKSGAVTTLYASNNVTGNNITVGGKTVLGKFGVINSAAGTIATVIRGASSQTANLTQWQNSAGTILSAIDSSGYFYAGSSGAATAKMYSDRAAVIVKGSTDGGTGPFIDYDINSSATAGTTFARISSGTLSTATSGTNIAVSMAPSFVPSGAGSGDYRVLDLSYTINGTAGTQTGTTTGIYMNATETTLNGMTSRLIELRQNGTPRFYITNGGYTFSNHFQSGGEYQFTSGSRLQAPSSGVLVLTNHDAATWNRLSFGGTTSSFPAIKRNGTDIQFRLADDSANTSIIYAGVTAAYVAKAVDYTLTSADHTVDFTATGKTGTLPTAVGITGKIFVICNSNGGTTTVATTSSQTIYLPGGTSTSVTLNDGEALTVQSTGSNWRAL